MDEDAYSYPMQVEYMLALTRELDLSDVTFFGQDWGGLIGLRVVAAAPDRFARVVVSNTALPAATGIQGWVGYPLFKLAVWWEGELTFEELRSNITFPRWVAYSYHIDDLPIGRLMATMGGDEAVRAAYEAPFPDRRYKAAAQIMPYLVPSQLRENEQAWAVFENWTSRFSWPSPTRIPSHAAARSTSSPACPMRRTLASAAPATSSRKTPAGSWPN